MKSVAATGLVVASPWVARGAGVITLRLPGATAESHPAHIGNVELAKSLKKRLGSSVDVQIFPNRQLGDDRQLLEGVVAGTFEVSQAGAILVNLVTKKVAFDSYQLPFLIDTYDNFEKLALGPTTEKILGDLDSVGLVGLSVYDVGQRHFLSVKSPVKKSGDFAGLKTRIVPVPLHKEIWEAVKTTPIGLPYGEVYGALQTKVIDAVETNVSSMIGENLWEVGKYFTLTGHYFWPTVLLANKTHFDAYPKEFQQALRESAREAVPPTMAYCKKQDFDGRDELKKKGVEIFELEDLAEMRKLVEPVIGRWSQKSPFIAEFVKEARKIVT
jgi:tripartite ATP-independent transporter DctP family solute receptor